MRSILPKLKMLRLASAAYLVVIVCFIQLISNSSAYTPPFVFRVSHRQGVAYKEALEMHEALHELYGLYPTDAILGYYDQLISHTEPALGTFRQRYWMNLCNNTSSDIAFLYINGESTGSPMNGYPAMLAEEFQAMSFSLEHRFYGESMPFQLTNRLGLKHLTVENALADLVAFMDHVENKIVKKQLRWVSVGGSYAGALSAWLKERYPDRLVAAWSSSGVVHAKFDFTAYDGHIVSVLPPDCLSKTESILASWERLYDNPVTRPELMDLFGTPSYFTKTEMAWALADSIAANIQYGKRQRYCTAMSEIADGDSALSDFVHYMFVNLGNQTFASCSYTSSCLTNKDLSDQWADSGYAWIYQTCSQLAYWQVAYPHSLRHPTITTDFFIKQCQEVFGDLTFPDVFKFNNVYGGEQPIASHVIALQGSDDPWMEVGVKKDLNPTYLAKIAECDDCGHCGDLYLPHEQDPPSLQAQRQYIREILRTWLLL